MIKRLRAKFVCINMALVMSVLLVILCLVYHFTAINLEKTGEAALKAEMHEPLKPGRPGSVGLSCFVLQEGPDGRLTAFGSEIFDLTDTQLLQQLYELANARNDDIGVLEGYDLRYYREQSAMGMRVVFTDISSERNTLAGLLGISVLVFAVAFVAFLVVSILLARWAIRPVEKAWEQQKQFVSDASHELKTPLTVILTNAEMLRAPEYAPQEKERFAENILDVSRQMRTLVENLLQLARADRGQSPHLVPVQLSELTEQAILPFEPVYFESGLMLETHIQPGLWVSGDAGLLRQVLGILLDNGRKYASGAQVRLQLIKTGRKVLLRFFTPGEPMTPEQCSAIFTRFYRLDGARTADGSYGLGLSIARNIVSQHGGTIRADGCDGGNLFTVTLPELRT